MKLVLVIVLSAMVGACATPSAQTDATTYNVVAGLTNAVTRQALGQGCEAPAIPAQFADPCPALPANATDVQIKQMTLLCPQNALALVLLTKAYAALCPQQGLVVPLMTPTPAIR